MLEKDVLGDKLPVKIQLGFFIQIIVIVVGMSIGYKAIQSDLEAAIRSNRTNESTLHEVLLSLELIKIDLRIQQQKLDDLKQLYDRDFNTYIRPPRQ
jgi:membrane protein required for beta-lactamase induction